MPAKKKTITMPVLALRGLMVFPHMVLHFDVGRAKSVAALEQAMLENQQIFLVAQLDAEGITDYRRYQAVRRNCAGWAPLPPSSR